MFTRKLAKITGTLKKYEYEMYDEQRLNNPGRLTLCKEAWGTFMITSRRPFPAKVPKTYRARSQFVKLRPAYSAKLVFSYVVKGIRIEITGKFSVSRRLRFEDTTRIMSPEMRLKRFGTL